MESAISLQRPVQPTWMAHSVRQVRAGAGQRQNYCYTSPDAREKVYCSSTKLAQQFSNIKLSCSGIVQYLSAGSTAGSSTFIFGERLPQTRPWSILGVLGTQSERKPLPTNEGALD